ncbi:hypothetical protein J3F83DRAFT_107423 [Trichoderma novae-zelandiae]
MGVRYIYIYSYIYLYIYLREGTGGGIFAFLYVSWNWSFLAFHPGFLTFLHLFPSLAVFGIWRAWEMWVMWHSRGGSSCFLLGWMVSKKRCVIGPRLSCWMSGSVISLFLCTEIPKWGALFRSDSCMTLASLPLPEFLRKLDVVIDDKGIDTTSLV